MASMIQVRVDDELKRNDEKKSQQAAENLAGL